MNCKKYRIKKYVNRNGVIYYIAQEKILGLFWRGMFRDTKDYESWFTYPEIFWNEDEAVKKLKSHLKIEKENREAHLAGKAKIKNNKYICVE